MSLGSSAPTGGRSWTEGRQAAERIRVVGPLGAMFSLEVKDRQKRGLGMRSNRSSVLSGGRSWTEGRQAEERLRAVGPLGAMFSLKVDWIGGL